MRAILRRLPDRASLALQRRLYPGGLVLDGMSEATRAHAVQAFFQALPDPGPGASCPRYGPPFDPPWVAFPDYPGMASMGFRMGGGEGYMCEFQAWYKEADDADIDAFKAAHPPPDHYANFYGLLDAWHRSAL